MQLCDLTLQENLVSVRVRTMPNPTINAHQTHTGNSFAWLFAFSGKIIHTRLSGTPDSGVVLRTYLTSCIAIVWLEIRRCSNSLLVLVSAAGDDYCHMRALFDTLTWLTLEEVSHHAIPTRHDWLLRKDLATCNSNSTWLTLDEENSDHAIPFRHDWLLKSELPSCNSITSE